jgi:6-phosphofructokinase 1
MLVQRKLKKLNFSVKSRPNEIGYELRCVRPIAYDLSYATLLGTGVMKLFQDGKSGCMITVTPKGDVLPLYMKEVEDENGKIKPRLINIESERVKLVYENNLHYITKNDYKAAKKYLPEPEEYDFKRILNW